MNDILIQKRRGRRRPWFEVVMLQRRDFTLKLLGYGISVSRFQRSARFSWEWHNWRGHRWLNITVGDPCEHRRWAFSATFYV